MLTIEVKDTEVNKALKALIGKVGNMRPVLQAIGEDIMERAKLRFASSSGPDGQRWKPNSLATIEAYLEQKSGAFTSFNGTKSQNLLMSKKPLIGESKSLSKQFHVKADGNSVTIGNSMIYAAIQQFDGQADRGKKVTIPARPFLPIHKNGNLYADDQAKIMETLNRYLTA